MRFFKLKTFLSTLGLLLITTSMMAQSSITLEATQVYSTFKFTDSNSNQDKSYSGIYTGAYGLGYRFASEKGLLVRAGVGMRRAGATMVYDEANYMWDLQYADVKVGVGYIYSGARVKPYFTASPYFAYLLKANQALNHENFDALQSESLHATDYGVFLTPGLQFRLSDAVSAYTEFNYMMGLQNIDTDEGEEAYNRAMGLTVGVSFTITKK